MTSTAAGQYATPKNLETRISIHDKYSLNKQGFGNWIFAQYELWPGARILELGCGTGAMWRGRLDSLPEGASLALSDLSMGMLAAARANLGDDPRIAYRQIDIQDIPCPDASFDVVIANMMLYHVPDIDRGLAEVRRVLRPGGRFYCATYGENSIVRYLAGLLPEFDLRVRISDAFTLQNGAARLRGVFAAVERRLYPDALRVTRLEDLLDYIDSLGAAADLRPEWRQEILPALARHMEDGALTIPKEYGLFIAE